MLWCIECNHNSDHVWRFFALRRGTRKQIDAMIPRATRECYRVIALDPTYFTEQEGA